MQDFQSSVFFHQSTPPRSLSNGLKPFRIRLRIRHDILTVVKIGFNGVTDTAETENEF
jgi:hypothetical protein